MDARGYGPGDQLYFTDYLVPLAGNTPRRIDIFTLDEEEDRGPFGAKGIDEPTTLPIANAIFDAVAVRIYDLPAMPTDWSYRVAIDIFSLCFSGYTRQNSNWIGFD